MSPSERVDRSGEWRILDPVWDMTAEGKAPQLLFMAHRFGVPACLLIRLLPDR
jgi:hypothetical protein